MEAYLGALRRVALFHGMGDRELLSMLDCLGARLRQYSKGDVIFHAGDPATHLGAVLTGQVQVSRTKADGQRVVMGEIRPGGLFAESFACARAESLPVTVTAAADAAVLLIDCGRISAPCSAACTFHTRLISNLLQVLAEKNLSLAVKLGHLSGRTIRERLGASLGGQGAPGQRAGPGGLSLRGPQRTVPHHRRPPAGGRAHRPAGPLHPQFLKGGFAMGTYLLSLDQGTTSSRAILFDREQNILGVAQKEFTQFYPREGWVEHDPMEIWSSQYGVMMEVIAQSGVNPAEIAAIGITNQRETTILWDRATGRPIYNAIVWQCRRTAELVDRLRADGLEEHIRAATGLVPDAYFSATKIKWVLDHVEGAREKARRGEILFGTVDAWLLWKLTGRAVHATDVTNASRTMLFDIHALDWDDTLLSALDIPRAMLPQVRPSSEVYGYTDIQGVRIPIAGMAGGQQGAP